MNSLCVERLSFERDDLPVLDEVNFTLSSGEIVQLAGPNGAGKTTLMRILAGLIHPTSGRVTWNDSAVQDYAFKSSLLFLGHQTGVKLTMTPLENLRWYFGLNGVKSLSNTQPPSTPSVSDNALIDSLSKVGLSDYHDVACYQLSAGQQRRVALARLYLSEAPLWLLDEPFTAIDKRGVSELESRIEQHVEKGGIVMLTTHQAWNADKIRVIDLEVYSGQRAAS